MYRLPSTQFVTDATQPTPPNTTLAAADDHSDSVIKSLSLVDRLLSVWIILVMVIGVVVGYYSSSAVDALNSVQVVTVSFRPVVHDVPRAGQGQVRVVWGHLPQERHLPPAPLQRRSQLGQLASQRASTHLSLAVTPWLTCHLLSATVCCPLPRS